jgi:hypothetical protein
MLNTSGEPSDIGGRERLRGGVSEGSSSPRGRTRPVFEGGDASVGLFPLVKPLGTKRGSRLKAGLVPVSGGPDTDSLYWVRLFCPATEAAERGLELGTRTVPLGLGVGTKKRDGIVRAVASRDCAGIDASDSDSADPIGGVDDGVDAP